MALCCVLCNARCVERSELSNIPDDAGSMVREPTPAAPHPVRRHPAATRTAVCREPTDPPRPRAGAAHHEEYAVTAAGAPAPRPTTDWDVVCLGESMITFLPDRPGPLAEVPSFTRAIGGAESNVACALAAAGQDAGVSLSLRLDLSAYGLFDPEGEEGRRGAGAAVLQVHSLADPTRIADAAALWSGERLPGFGPRARIDAALALRRAARVWAPLERLADQPVPDVLSLDDAELSDLLGVAAERLRAAGVPVHWPRELARELTAEAEVRGAPGSATDGTPFFDADRLLEFRWQVALGGERLSEAEMDELAEAHRPVVRLRDQWVVVDPEVVRRARKRDLGLLDPVDALGVALTGTAEVDGEPVQAVPVGALAALRDRLAAPPGRVEPPAGLNATLRDYQLRGLGWLELMTSLGLGGCLADDMGLGKTVTLIALHLKRAGTGPTLVVCPASLLGNWEREIARFAPGVPVRRYHGQGRSLGDVPDGFVLTTYGTMRSSAESLGSLRWGLVVADEAQHVKNPHSATAQALRTLPAAARVALTGTPVENNLSELWALLDWTTPGLLGPLTAFRARHARLVESGEDPEAAERLARLVRPFLLRRRKSDPGIVPELPPKTETDRPVPLTREQASLYEAVVRESMAAIERSEGIARRGLVLKLLTSLKQICNHPALALKEQGASEDFLKRSVKLQRLEEILDEVVEAGDRALLFTQFAEWGKLLQDYLQRRWRSEVPFLSGSTSKTERQAMVDRFQEDPRGPQLFLLSLKAGGVGLNLTRASHVFHIDRWWNPAVENQATDRAYRIGQTNRVMVHKFITSGSVEEKIDRMIREKSRLAEDIIGSGEDWLGGLEMGQLKELVSLEDTST